MFPDNRFPLAPALWHDTAVEPAATTPLGGRAETDTLIIGGGYAGLSTALHLAESGAQCMVLEAKEIGFGGSGRNGGQLVPGLKKDPSELIAAYGAERGGQMIEFAQATVSTVFSVIDRHKLNVPHTRNGWIQPAHSQTALSLVQKRLADWQKQGAPVRGLSRSELADLLGTDQYYGGWFDERGGSLQPLSYVRELARAALQAGALVHTDTAVQFIEKKGSGWHVTTSSGYVVQARRVVVCANAYSDGIWKNLKESVVDPNTYQVATAPLPDDIAKTVLPHGQPVSDTRNLLLYFRKDHTGRFMMGGRGPFREPRGKQDWDHLKKAITLLYPQLKDIAFEYYWCGRVSVTQDYMPHLHQPEPGLILNIGCQGRGIGLQTAMGKAIASYLQTGNEAALPVPFTPVQRLPFYGLRKLYVGALISWYRYLDSRT
ncbi:FAD-dependent oxidoreductase [Advenella sp. S44]|uniref:NAD(P)/FAD-dependent oxidoreductase n=1 Tax=Advenella sp. S44 TaxID=1982755 RepID=UPI000C2A23FE|nr:FAD-binding oxidoreductase [Advenella sp. S44]PJX25917.1 FAD-dependent oxidoreductase [Advenella sp. S44]